MKETDYKVPKWQKKVIVPDSVSCIDTLFFSGCEELEEVILPSTLKIIPKFCFSGCSKLREVIIPDSVNSIDTYAFYNCSELKKVGLPNKLENISANCFADCSKLKEIIIPDSVDHIDECAFYNCSELEKITLPNTLKSISAHCFSECSKLKEIVIPDSVNCIAEGAFDNCSRLEKVVLPNTLKSISAHCFSGCSNLKEIVIPDSVNCIDEFAFHKCTALEEILIPQSVRIVGHSAFGDCRSLKKVRIPGSVKVIGLSAFFDTALEEVELQEGIEEIGESAFWVQSAKLKYIKLPSSLRKIGNWAFNNNDFRLVSLPSGIQEIGSNAFETVYSWSKQTVQYFVLKDSPAERYLKEQGLQYKYHNAAAGFASCEEVFNGVQYYSENCQAKVQIPSGVKTIAEYAFANHKEIKEIAFPASLRVICAHAFDMCSTLQALSFKSGLEEIGAKAFCDFAGDLVELPASIKKLAPDAFPQNCVVSIGGEMPFYAEKRAAIVNQRKAIKGKKADAKILLQDKALIEQERSKILKREPTVSEQVPYYEHLVGEIQGKIDTNEQDRVRKRKQPDEELSQIDMDICALVEARDIDFSAAAAVKKAQEEKINALKLEREQCFFLAVSKKKALEAEILELTEKSEQEFMIAVSKRDSEDAVLQSKQNERANILNRIHQIDAETDAVCAPLRAELNAAASERQRLLLEHQAAYVAWEAEKQSIDLSYKELEKRLRSFSQEIEAAEKELSGLENTLNVDHENWMYKRNEILDTRKKQQLEKEKARIISLIGSPQYRQEKIFQLIRRESIIEEELLNKCYIEQVDYRNKNNMVQANNTFINAHESELARIREINRALGICENDGIKATVILEAPINASEKLPDRFIKLNAYFGKTDSWRALKAAANRIQDSNGTRRNVTGLFFKKQDTICFASGKDSIFFFPYCVVFFRPGEQMKVFTYNAAKMTIKHTDMETSAHVPPNGELLSERYTHINKDGTPSRRYKENPIIRTIRFTTVTVSDGRDKVSFPVTKYLSALRLQETYVLHTTELCDGVRKRVYEKILASENMDVVERAIKETADAERARKEQERKKAEAEKRRLEEISLAEQAAAEERRKAIIQKQRKINEERKRQERESAEEAKRVAQLFDDDYEEKPHEKISQNDSYKKPPADVLGNRLISNTVFKITICPHWSLVPDGMVVYFVSTSGDIISNKKKLEQTSSGEITVGFVLNSGIDYTGMRKCFLRFEQQGEFIGEVEFKMNISFCSDF